MRKLLLMAGILLLTNNILSQEYVEEGRKRLNFAKTYFELGSQYTSLFIGKKIGVNNAIQSFENPASLNPFLNIGGLHFWGHADFFISIPLAQIKLNTKDSLSFNYNNSVITGMRIMPWAYKDHKIRPYIGASWAVVNLNQDADSEQFVVNFSDHKILFDVGLVYGKKNLMVRLGVNYNPKNQWNYPISKTNFESINTPKFSPYFGLIYSYESTRSKNMEKINRILNKYPNLSSPTMNATKKGDWFLGIGPSTSFIVSESDYNQGVNPFFAKKAISNIFFDIALGYQFNKAGLVAVVSYRNPTFRNESFGVKQDIEKQSVVFEVFKFLTDYSGFTPYVGLNIGFDRLKFTELSDKNNLSFDKNIVNPGLTFGWDILPGKTQQPFVLRTNLRWFPFEKLNVNDKNFSLNQIEYNVIQAVFYPSRFKKAKLMRD
jgi:hypothetical protein